MIAISLYARYIGTMGFITKEHSIYHDKLPDDYDGLKIVHFTDLHYKRAISKEKIEKIELFLSKIPLGRNHRPSFLFL